MTEQWQDLKEAIIEMRDNGGTATQKDVCDFLATYMGILELDKQMQEPCDDCISRQEAIRAILKIYHDHAVGIDIVDIVAHLPSVTPNIKLTNSEWINFLASQFDISRTSAKEMLHVMMSVKKEDNFKKSFSGAKKMVEPQESEAKE